MTAFLAAVAAAALAVLAAAQTTHVPGVASDVYRAPTPTSTPTPAPTATPTPTLAPKPTPTAVPYGRGALTGEQVRSVLRQTGWPEYLIEQAAIVAWKESSYRPRIINSIGCCYGLFQLHARTWAPYCGVTPRQLLDPYVNAACAYQVYRYDIDRGRAPWSSWEAKPW